MPAVMTAGITIVPMTMLVRIVRMGASVAAMMMVVVIVAMVCTHPFTIVIAVGNLSCCCVLGALNCINLPRWDHRLHLRLRQPALRPRVPRLQRLSYRRRRRLPRDISRGRHVFQAAAQLPHALGGDVEAVRGADAKRIGVAVAEAVVVAGWQTTAAAGTDSPRRCQRMRALQASCAARAGCTRPTGAARRATASVTLPALEMTGPV